MILIARIALSTVLVVGASPSSWAQSDARPQACSAEIQEALIAALRYSLENVSDDHLAERIDLESPVIPDYGILRRDGRIYIRDYVDDPGCVLGKSLLPQSESVTFALVDEDRLRRLARRNGEGITFVRAREVVFREDEAEIRLGVALQLVPGDERGLACCCGGEMILRRVSGEWVFEEWRNVFCA